MWIHCFGPEPRFSITVVEANVKGGGSPHGRKEVERRNRKRPGPRYSLHHSHPSPHQLTPATRSHIPQFCHLPITHSKFESISGLNHWLGQDPYDPITSGNSEVCLPRYLLLGVSQSRETIKINYHTEHHHCVYIVKVRFICILKYYCIFLLFLYCLF
jgi:hypothetical protein